MLNAATNSFRSRDQQSQLSTVNNKLCSSSLGVQGCAFVERHCVLVRNGRQNTLCHKLRIHMQRYIKHDRQKLPRRSITYRLYQNQLLYKTQLQQYFSIFTSQLISQKCFLTRNILLKVFKTGRRYIRGILNSN